MSRPDFPNLTLLTHPLIQHKLTLLRDKRTPTKDFKQLAGEIAMLMAYEVTNDLPLEAVEIDTPLEHTRGVQVAGKKLTLVPILRAGLGMVEGIAQLIPSARVGHIGLYRDHDTLQPVDYYFKIPSGEQDRAFFVLDPMLATGGESAQEGGGRAGALPVPRRRPRGREGHARRALGCPRVRRRPRPPAQRARLHPPRAGGRGGPAVRHALS